MMRPTTFIGGPVPRERLTWAIENGSAHLKPIYVACRDHGCAQLVVAQHAGRFDPPDWKRPTIVVIGDDMHEAYGPAAFHRKSVRLSIQKAGLIAVMSAAPMVEAYTSVAAFVAIRRRHAVIIETRTAFEIPWTSLAMELNPEAQWIISSIRGGTA